MPNASQNQKDDDRGIRTCMTGMTVARFSVLTTTNMTIGFNLAFLDFDGHYFHFHLYKHQCQLFHKLRKTLCHPDLSEK
jgi:hypothetical protein